LVYSSGYTRIEARHLGGNIWEEGGQDVSAQPRAGSEDGAGLGFSEAWSGRSPSDGRNLVLHEFAHQLDFEIFDRWRTRSRDAGRLLTWARVMAKEFEHCGC